MGSFPKNLITAGQQEPHSATFLACRMPESSGHSAFAPAPVLRRENDSASREIATYWIDHGIYRLALAGRVALCACQI